MSRRRSCQDHGEIFYLAHRERYVVIVKETLEDERLSAEARGVLAYLLCKPPGWIVRETALLNHFKQSERPMGRDRLRSALRELRKYGYFRRIKRRNPNGRIFYVTAVYESPRICQEHWSQPSLFEDLMQRAVPGSIPVTDADDNPPPLFDRGRDFSQRREADAATNANGSPESPHRTKKPLPENPSTVSQPRKPLMAHQLTVRRKTEARPPTEEPCSEEPSQKIDERESAAAGARRGDCQGGKLEAALIEAGIGEPTRSELIETGGLTPAIVKREHERCREGGKGTGVLVENLRTAAERERLRAERTPPSMNGAAQAATQKRDDQQIESDRKAVDAALARLTDAELQERAKTVKRDRPWLRTHDPEQSRMLRQAIADDLCGKVVQS